MFKDTHAYSGFAVDDIDPAREFYGETLGIETRSSTRRRAAQLDSRATARRWSTRSPTSPPATYTILNFPVAGRRRYRRCPGRARRGLRALRGLRPGREGHRPQRVKARRSPGSATRRATSSPSTPSADSSHRNRLPPGGTIHRASARSATACGSRSATVATPRSRISSASASQAAATPDTRHCDARARRPAELGGAAATASTVSSRTGARDPARVHARGEHALEIRAHAATVHWRRPPPPGRRRSRRRWAAGARGRARAGPAPRRLGRPLEQQPVLEHAARQDHQLDAARRAAIARARRGGGRRERRVEAGGDARRRRRAGVEVGGDRADGLARVEDQRPLARRPPRSG